MTPELPLTGPWRFRPDQAGLGEPFAEELHYTHAPAERSMRADLDDSGWQVVDVPHTWPQDPAQTWRVLMQDGHAVTSNAYEL